MGFFVEQHVLVVDLDPDATGIHQTLLEFVFFNAHLTKDVIDTIVAQTLIALGVDQGVISPILDASIAADAIKICEMQM